MQLGFLRQKYFKSMYLHKLIHTGWTFDTIDWTKYDNNREFVQYLAASNQRLKRA